MSEATAPGPIGTRPLPSLATLTGVELRRLTARRFVRFVALAVAVGLLGVAAIMFVHSNRNLAAAHARASAAARAVTSHAPVPPASARAACKKAELAGTLPAGSCAKLGVPTGPPASVFYQDPRLFFATSIVRHVEGATIFVGLLAFLVGASAVGAEWSAGTFTGLLTIEPRRLRVLVAKTVAVVAGAVLTLLAAQAFEVAVTALTAATRGSMTGTTTRVLLDALWTALRGVGLVAFLAASGAAVAGVTRSTAAALGLLAAYLVGVEVFFVHFVPSWQPWTLKTASTALLSGHATLIPPPGTANSATFTTCSGANCTSLGVGLGHPIVVSSARGGTELVVAGAVLLGLWAFTLLRRDAA